MPEIVLSSYDVSDRLIKKHSHELRYGENVYWDFARAGIEAVMCGSCDPETSHAGKCPHYKHEILADAETIRRLKDQGHPELSLDGGGLKLRNIRIVEGV